MFSPAVPEPALAALIEGLRRLPGVGVKSAQRMAYHLLQHDPRGAARLAAALDTALKNLRHCHGLGPGRKIAATIRDESA